MVPARRMIWSDGFLPLFKGVRTFELKSCDNGSTDFMKEERFSGILFAVTKRMLPSVAYASDLKRDAERIGHERAI